MGDRIKFWLRRWLGVEAEIAQFQADLNGHTEITRLMAEQLNRTTLGAADVMARLAYYEQHVESVRYAHTKLTAKGNGHSESKIIRLGHD